METAPPTEPAPARSSSRGRATPTSRSSSRSSTASSRRLFCELRLMDPGLARSRFLSPRARAALRQYRRDHSDHRRLVETAQVLEALGQPEEARGGELHVIKRADEITAVDGPH